MMLKVLLLFVLLLAGIVVGPMIAGHRGYVLIQTDTYNIETSVTGGDHSHRRYGGAIRH